MAERAVIRWPGSETHCGRSVRAEGAARRWPTHARFIPLVIREHTRSGHVAPFLWLAMIILASLSQPLAAQVRPPADYANTQLSDPAREAEANALMQTLRCLVCQGQSIADSDADMAGDMRALVRRRIEAGESGAQVREWLIARYGDYVSYNPPISALTLPLWLTPVVLLVIGAWIARSSFRRRKRGQEK